MSIQIDKIEIYFDDPAPVDFRLRYELRSLMGFSAGSRIYIWDRAPSAVVNAAEGDLFLEFFTVSLPRVSAIITFSSGEMQVWPYEKLKDFGTYGSFSSSYASAGTFMQAAANIERPNIFPWSNAVFRERLAEMDFNVPLNLETTLDGEEMHELVKYTRRDQTLSYRDLLLVKNLLKMVLEIVTVWNSDPERLFLPATIADVPLPDFKDDSSVVESPGVVDHLLGSATPKDAVDVDEDLYARDLLLNEAIARLATIFPLEGLKVPASVVRLDALVDNDWSKAKGKDIPLRSLEISEQWDINAFSDPDKTLAYRDNVLASALAFANRFMLNVYANAERLYLKTATYVTSVTGVGAVAAITTAKIFDYTYPDTIALESGDLIAPGGFDDAYFFNGNRPVEVIGPNAFRVTLSDAEWDFVLNNPPADYVGTVQDWLNGGWVGYTATVQYSLRYPVSRREPEVYVLTEELPERRVWRAEPFLSSNRLALVYDVAEETLQWTNENLSSIHLPQPITFGIAGLSKFNPFIIKGIDPGQELEVVATAPVRPDLQFYRQKANRINFRKEISTQEFYSSAVSELGDPTLQLDETLDEVTFVPGDDAARFIIPASKFTAIAGKRYRAYFVFKNSAVSAHSVDLRLFVEQDTSSTEKIKTIAMPTNRPDALDLSFVATSGPVTLGLKILRVNKDVNIKILAIQVVREDDAPDIIADSSEFAGWRTELVKRAERGLITSYNRTLDGFKLKPEFRRFSIHSSPDAVTPVWRLLTKVEKARSYTYQANSSVLSVTALPDLTSGLLTEGTTYFIVSGARPEGTFLDGELRFNNDIFVAETAAVVPQPSIGEGGAFDPGMTLRPIEFFEGDPVLIYINSSVATRANVILVDFNTIPGIVFLGVDLVPSDKDETGTVVPAVNAPSFIATNLPPGVTLNSATGVFEGTALPVRIRDVDSLIRVGTKATAILRSRHDYPDGAVVTMAGADIAVFNGDKLITVIDNKTFTFEMPVALAGEADEPFGVISVRYNPRLVNITVTDDKDDVSTESLEFTINNDIPQRAIWNVARTEGWMDLVSGEEPRLRIASKVGRPHDIGRPAIVPAGLEFISEGILVANFEVERSIPQITTFQAWMLEFGFYVLDEDLWSPKEVA